MKLLRLVSAHFEPFPEGWESWITINDDIVVSTMKTSEDPTLKSRLLLTAAMEINFPDINGDGFIVIPEDARQQLEKNLVIASDLVAIFGRCKRSISSAIPSVALIPTSDVEREVLDTSKGFLINRQFTAGLQAPLPRDMKLIQGLEDRFEGVALMAEAHSQSLGSGRFREYVRLFEAGFSMQFSELAKKLLQFLEPRFGYTRPEIESWIALRDPLTHADRKRTTKVLFNLDILPKVRRMEQAAYDVLFNKVVWGEKSRDRRQLWTPSVFTTSASTNLNIEQGYTGQIQFDVFDEFGVFPLDFQCSLTPLPVEWWCRFPNNHVASLELHIKSKNSEIGA